MTDAQTIINEADNISLKYSFEGYTFPVAVYRNRNEIKLFLAVITGISVIPPFDLRSTLTSIGVAFVILMAKIGIDALHFFFKNVDLNKK